MVNQSDVVVFMKGVPSAPRCGFSNAVCQIMRMHDVPFESHDVLSDEEVRQGKNLFLKFRFSQKVTKIDEINQSVKSKVEISSIFVAF